MARGIYLTRAEVTLHEWRVILRDAQRKLQDARNVRGKGSRPAIESAEENVLWALGRVTSAQTTVQSERAWRAKTVESLISV